MPIKDMMGMRFTRLLVLSRAPSDKNGNARWNCQCDCGDTTISSGFTLRNGEAKSCGCLTTDQLRERGTSHGKSGTPEHQSWAGMLQRCYNPNSRNYPRYGGRGIKVCQRWHKFEEFYADMGDRASLDHTLERINNDGPYAPGNCRWATTYEQNFNKYDNRMVDYRGQRVPLMRALEIAGTAISYTGVRWRLDNGWSVEKALETPASTKVWTATTFPSEPTTIELRRAKRGKPG